MADLNVKKGDTVLVYQSQYGEVKKRLSTVDNVTPTGRIKVNGLTFAPNGSKMGGNELGTLVRIEEISEEQIEEIKEEIKRDKVIKIATGRMRDFNGTLAYEDAVAILNILEKYKKK